MPGPQPPAWGAQSSERQTWHTPGSAAVPDRAWHGRVSVGRVWTWWLRACGQGPCCQGRGSRVGAHLCPALQGAGGWRHLGEGDDHRSASARTVTINMSELLRAVRDCSIDFSAQLFSCVLARAIPQCCRSCASALPTARLCQCRAPRRNNSKMSCFRRGLVACKPAGQGCQGSLACLLSPACRGLIKLSLMPARP